MTDREMLQAIMNQLKANVDGLESQTLESTECMRNATTEEQYAQYAKLTDQLQAKWDEARNAYLAAWAVCGIDAQE